VAITGENRVLAIDLKAGWQAGGHEGQVFVSDYVRAAVNAPADFTFPDNLALDKAGNLYITEDPGGSAAGGKTLGDDVWAAPFNPGSSTQSLPAERFLSITDCDAEPTGIYFSPTGRTLFVNIQHRGGADPRDLALAIKRLSSIDFLKASVASESR
jgi:secreted PhoX family phosphatase